VVEEGSITAGASRASIAERLCWSDIAEACDQRLSVVSSLARDHRLAARRDATFVDVLDEERSSATFI
jgi:hypothetical protein